MKSITYLLLSMILPSLIHAETLRGTTILNWPYVNQRPNGQFEGFCIDLLNELAPLMGVAYTLSVVPDGQYGGWVQRNGSINGMIGQVMRGEADFAIGDLTVLSNRVRFVDFTLSFMDYGLAAMVRRDVLQRYGPQIRTFKDLSEQTAIRYGVKKHGANLPLFHDGPVVAKMYSFMDTHPSVFVSGEREGLQKVKQDRYAFITESPFVEYVVQRDCDLMMIDDRRKNFEFEYAIAVPKNSALKERFSKAIRKLRAEGKIRELKDRYWRNPRRNCPDDPDFNPDRPQSTSTRIQFSHGTDGSANVDSGRSIDKNQVERPPFSDQDDPKDPSGRLRQGGRLKPHDQVDEEDVELIKPRPDQDSSRRRRPTINRRRQFNQGQSYTKTTNCWLYLMTIILILLHISFNL